MFKNNCEEFFDPPLVTLDPRPFTLDPRLVTLDPRPKGKLYFISLKRDDQCLIIKENRTEILLQRSQNSQQFNGIELPATLLSFGCFIWGF